MAGHIPADIALTEGIRSHGQVGPYVISAIHDHQGRQRYSLGLPGQGPVPEILPGGSWCLGGDDSAHANLLGATAGPPRLPLAAPLSDAIAP